MNEVINEEYEPLAEMNSNQNQLQLQFSHSAKLTSTAKGVRIDVHCYGNSSEEVRQQLLKMYVGIETDLRNHSIVIAPIESKQNGVKA